jgi:hypothetical protein
MERAPRDSRGPGRSTPEPGPGIGRKDLPDPDRDLTEPGRPAPNGEQEDGDPDEDAGRPVQLEIPATEELVAREQVTLSTHA